VTIKTVKPKERQGFPVTEPSREGKEGLCQGITLYIKKNMKVKIIEKERESEH
jgi:hypothetical protein